MLRVYKRVTMRCREYERHIEPGDYNIEIFGNILGIEGLFGLKDDIMFFYHYESDPLTCLELFSDDHDLVARVNRNYGVLSLPFCWDLLRLVKNYLG